MNVRKLKLSRSGQFWVFQLTGWSIWVILLLIRDRTFVPREYMLDRAGVFLLDAVVGILLTTALRYLYRYVWDMSAQIRLAAVILGSLLASFAWRPIKLMITSTEFGAVVDLTGYGYGSYNSLIPVTFGLLVGWSVLYFLIKYYQLFQLEKEKSLRSEALAHEAQLRMLRYQLNPHFLFNTLNAISTLVLQQSTVCANEMLTKLSKFLRYSLEHDPLDQVDLAHEIVSARLYLDIEKVRFEERMQIEINISNEAQQALVPSMLLQPLVENSIKHAISRSEEGGMIEISAEVDKLNLIIRVSDDGPGPPEGKEGETPHPTSMGVGLKNIRDRLREMYGDGHSLVITRRQPKGCTVTVTIPYETK